MGHGCSWAWESLLPSSNSLHAFLELFSSVHPNHNLPSYDRKFWCKRDRDGICYTIISTTNFISKDHMGRVALEDVPQHGTFMVTMTQLKTSRRGFWGLLCPIGSLQLHQT
uniref:Uncharacterized protein n=1 Tax=Gallus gallus TaxID=9031 RepID=A0A8V1AA05_CHICK